MTARLTKSRTAAVALAAAGIGIVTIFVNVRAPTAEKVANVHERRSAVELPPNPPGSIDMSSLLLEMIDLPRLALAPEPPYTAHLASSYDRRSRSPAETEPWFANDDWASRERPNYVRLESNAGRREYVLLETDGPGALVRLWTATPTGVLRIYLDGEKEPALAAPLEDLLGRASRFPAALRASRRADTTPISRFLIASPAK